MRIFALLRNYLPSEGFPWSQPVVDMKSDHSSQTDPESSDIEKDPVWKLLDASAPAVPSAHFVDDTVRAMRLAESSGQGWRRWLRPVPVIGLAGMSAAAAAIVITMFQIRPDLTDPAPLHVSAQNSASFSEIQELAAAEILNSAVDHLDQFSDGELVSLIGF
ncbi:MAG: hypothetical protein ACO3RV_01280 [Luteolibacter sp.]